MARSTSIHRLSGDRPLGRVGRQVYFLLNELNNRWFPNAAGDELEVCGFGGALTEGERAGIDVRASPARELSNLLWRRLPWAAIADAIGDIRVVDTGCGTGGYGQRLMEFSGNRVSQYRGIDLRPRTAWEQLEHEDNRFSFRAVSASDFAASIPGDTTLFMSQSAIEHFTDDLLHFRQIRDFIAQRAQPTLQVHLFPSAACLRLYRTHGVRQYTPRTVSKITRLFQSFSRARLLRLGGPACNAVHWEWIMGPMLRRPSLDRRKVEPGEYGKQLIEAIGADLESPSHDPTFYALVIQCHLPQDVLAGWPHSIGTHEDRSPQ